MTQVRDDSKELYQNVSKNDQSAYIKCRYIGCNAKLIQDIFDYCEDQNKNGFLLFLHFEKILYCRMDIHV